MVNREIIEDILFKSVEVVKCRDYPKALALKNFNEEDFQKEFYEGYVDSEVIPSPVGKLQEFQAKLQESVTYESLEKGVLRCYSCDSFIPINSYLNDVTDWMEDLRIKWKLYDFGNGPVMPVLDETKDKNGDWVDLSIPEQIEFLDRIMEKSPRIGRDSLVYRYGVLPSDIEVGGHGRFKGYQSTSYNPFVSFKDIPEGGEWVRGEKDIRYKMRIFVPSGIRGVVLNEHSGCVDWQSELLLDRNQRYVVLAKNDDDMTADILLY